MYIGILLLLIYIYFIVSFADFAILTDWDARYDGAAIDDDEAVEEFTEALRIDPNFEDACYMRGLCCMKTGDTNQAAEDLETVISMTTNSYRKRMAEQSLQQLNE